MKEPKYTAENIFDLVRNQSVTKDEGIKLIKNYNRKRPGTIEILQNEFGGHSGEIETAFNRINARLDETLKNITGAGK